MSRQDPRAIPQISFESADTFIVHTPGENDDDAISAYSSEGSEVFLGRRYPETPNGRALVKNKVSTKRTKVTTNDAGPANDHHLGIRTYSHESTHSDQSDVVSLSDFESKDGEDETPHQQETAFLYNLSTVNIPSDSLVLSGRQATAEFQEMGSFFGDQPTIQPGSVGQTLHLAEAKYAAFEADVSEQAPESTVAKSSNDQHSSHH